MGVFSSFRVSVGKLLLALSLCFGSAGTQAAVDITIDATLADSISSALALGDVTISTAGGNTPDTSTQESPGSGTIYITAPISWSSDSTLTLAAAENIVVSASLSATGNNAGLKIHYGGSSSVLAPAANTAYKLGLSGGTRISLSGTQPVLEIANQVYTVLNGHDSVADLQAIGMTAGSYTALGEDFSLSATYEDSFYTAPYSGTFDGLGHSIDGLRIRNSSAGNLGLFAVLSGATIRNLGVTNADIETSSDDPGFEVWYHIGALAALVTGASVSDVTNIEGTWSSGSISTQAGSSHSLWFAGGLIGNQNGGKMILTRSYSSASVSSASSSGRKIALGGLIGNIGLTTMTVSTNSSASDLIADISRCYATGSVLSGDFVGYYGSGSLIGVPYGTGIDVSDCFAHGNAVSANSFGGLFGWGSGVIVENFYTTEPTLGNGSYTKTNVYTSLTLNTNGGTTLPAGFDPAVWNVGELPTLRDIAAPPTLVYVRQTEVAGAAGAPALDYQLVDRAGEPISLDDLSGVTGLTGDAKYTIDETTPAGNYNVSYLSGLSFVGSGSYQYVLVPYDATSYVLSSKTLLTYTLGDLGIMASDNPYPALPVPVFSGGTPTGTVTVEVFDAGNVNVTAQYHSAALGGGVYSLRASLSGDASYAIAGSGNTAGVLTVSELPSISTASYDWSSGTLVVSGSAFTALVGSANDIDTAMLTLSGEGGNSHTLSASADVDIDSATQFSVVLDTADKLAVNALLNRNGTLADDGSSFELAAASGYMPAAPSGAPADAANTVNVSGFATPVILSAALDAAAATLDVSASGLSSLGGAANDVVVSRLHLHGAGGGSYTLSSSDVDISSDSSFTVALNATDMQQLAPLIDRAGAAALDGGQYLLSASDNWLAGAPGSEDISQSPGLALTVNSYPEISLSLSAGSVAEAASVTITATSSELATSDMTLQLQITGSASAADFTAPGSITIPAGQSSASIVLGAVDDSSPEPDESLQISIASVAAMAAVDSTQHALVISDTDTSALTLGVDQSTISESESVVLTVSLQQATFEDVVVTLGYSGSAVAGEDYNSPPLSLTIEAGQTSAAATLGTIQDGQHDPDETIVIDIVSVSGGHAVEQGVQQQTVLLGNTPPVAADDQFTLAEDTVQSQAVLANDSDADAGDAPDPGSIVITQQAGHGSLSVDLDSGEISYRPDAEYHGPDSYQYTVNDLQGETSNPASVAITVTAVNDPPVATADSYTVQSGTELIADVLANDSDPEHDSLDAASIEIVSQPLHGVVAVAAGKLAYTADAGYDGDDQLSYRVADAAGLYSAAASVQITVLPEAQAAADLDQDGIPDSEDSDTDGDGIADSEEGSGDADGDGIPNHRDTDADGDGIADADEGTGDTDNDGIPDSLDSDADGDGIADVDEGAGDADGDSIPDYLELDADGDMIPDALEAGFDTDQDGIPDRLETDADNDGIFDLIENAVDPFAAAAGDRDNDGRSDPGTEPAAGQTPEVLDSDGDGIADFRDLDSDNDGIPDATELASVLVHQQRQRAGEPAALTNRAFAQYRQTDDRDDDAIIDTRDLDSDNDGITDIVEAGGVDEDRDGRVDSFVDTDGNGLDDGVQAMPLEVPDSDDDGLRDFLDLDSDQDSLSDIAESGGVDSDFDGRVDDYIDSDNDGLTDHYGLQSPPLPDTDADGLHNYRDLDSDGDGSADIVEAGRTDTDGDGKVDVVSDSNGNGIPDLVDVALTAGEDADGDFIDDRFDSSFADAPDSDEDGIIDEYDPDADGDGWVHDDTGSQPAVGAALPDSDKDGIADVNDNSDDVVRIGLSGGCSLNPQSAPDPLLWLMLLAAAIFVLRSRRSRPSRARSFGTLILLLYSLLAFSAVASEKQGVFLGLGAGLSHLSPDVDGTVYTVDKESDLAVSALLGYRFNRRLAAELTVLDAGSASLSPSGSAGYRDLNLSLLNHLWQGQLPATAKPLSFFTRLGVGHLQGESDLQLIEENAVHWLAGAGLELSLDQRFSLRAEGIYYSRDMQQLGVSLLVHFGAPAPLAALPGSAPSETRVAQAETVVAESAPAEEQRIPALPANADLLFDFDSENLRGDTARQLVALAEMLRQHPHSRIVLTGHADSLGPDSYNLPLSRRRAEAVAAFLLRRGIDAARIQIVARGEADATVQQGGIAARQADRRVQAQLD